MYFVVIRNTGKSETSSCAVCGSGLPALGLNGKLKIHVNNDWEVARYNFLYILCELYRVCVLATNFSLSM